MFRAVVSFVAVFALLMLLAGVVGLVIGPAELLLAIALAAGVAALLPRFV